jgi:hypothetical protein
MENTGLVSEGGYGVAVQINPLIPHKNSTPRRVFARLR